MICRYADYCSGCSQWSMDYAEQVAQKTEELQSRGRQLGYKDEVRCHTLGPTSLRDRADLQWRAGEGWGFLDKEFKKVRAIEQCPLFTKYLQKLFDWWSRQSLKASKASVRLRVDAESRWGVWLDMANIDIKDLLEEDGLLTEWVSRAHVEIGQRYKVLEKLGGKWKLVDPVLRPWFTTTNLTGGHTIPLYGSIGSFTQVGMAINHKLVQTVLARATEQSCRRVVELGAGSGNFTLALAAEKFQVIALEQNAWALKGLERSIHGDPCLQSQVELVRGDFQRINWGQWTTEPSLLLLDPPRSGIGENLLRQIPTADFPTIGYVACGLNSWFSDGQRLRELGYQLSSLEWVDQFPQTPLFEIVSFWQKS